ncbi:MAG: IS110 family transposase [Firmicutes bacterium]|nr:IS110 family transposase [Bacillota bacterium]MDY3091762.1 IS110 family transposase [Erysipelotrichaceae bacterium]
MTYFIGIDLAKYKHDCFIMDQNGEVIRDSFSFTNDSEGFNTLLNVLNSLDSNQEKRIGFESTGHYGSNLKIFLERNGYSFMEFNPLLTYRHFKSETLRRTKNDKVDARKISSYLYTREYKPNPNSSYHLNCLKSLTRTRNALIKERTRHIIHMTNILDVMFPEFRPQFKDTGLKSATAIYLLENYGSPSKMANMTKTSYDKMKSKLRHTISYAKFIKIKELARNTVGNEDEILIFELNTYLELFKELEKKIQCIEDKIINEFSTMKCHISSIKGIGIITAAGILAEIESIDKFDNPGQLCAFAGIEPSENQSGTHDGGGKMVKHGSPHLRNYLMQTAEKMLIHNPVLYEYYLKKRDEGKHHNVALSHVARRLTRIIFYLEKNDTDFNIEKMR